LRLEEKEVRKNESPPDVVHEMTGDRYGRGEGEDWGKVGETALLTISARQR